MADLVYVPQSSVHALAKISCDLQAADACLFSSGHIYGIDPPLVKCLLAFLLGATYLTSDRSCMLPGPALVSCAGALGSFKV
jgi:hypothetical protein